MHGMNSFNNSDWISLLNVAKINEQEKKMERKDIIIRFRRAMKRLVVLKRFTKVLGIKMDPSSFEISQITMYKKKDLEDKIMDIEAGIERLIMLKVADKVEIDSFFPKGDLAELKEMQSRLAKLMRKNKNAVITMENFLCGNNEFVQDWLHMHGQNPLKLKAMVTSYYTQYLNLGT